MNDNKPSFSVLGVRIKLDVSWILLSLLIAWSLASGTFPAFYHGLPRLTYWGMAAATVVGVAISIILHELAHTMVARAFGLPIRSITLFIFGGVVQVEGEPKAPVAELLMALAGPIVSAILGLALLGAGDIFSSSPVELVGVLQYLGLLNLMLAVFNMAPAFPMDGGRVLRAIVWLVSGDAAKATRIAARAGEVVGILLMAAGALAALGTALVAGLWWIAIGWFIFATARMELAQAEARRLLSGARVAEFMTHNPVTAPAEMNVHDFVETVLARFPHDFVPIVAKGRPIGAAGFKEVSRTPRDRWLEVSMGEIATPLSQIPVADKDDAIEATLQRMNSVDASRAIVVDHGAVTGILTLKDLASHLRFKATFAEQQPSPGKAPAA
jgi:Zn-dependent protease